MGRQPALQSNRQQLESLLRGAMKERYDGRNIGVQRSRQTVTPKYILRVVVSDPCTTFRILPNEGFERQVEPGGRFGLHERRSGFWVPENEQLLRAHRQARTRSVATEVYAGEYPNAALLQESLKALSGRRH